MAKVKAFELDTAAAGYSGGEPVHFGGFPGMWEPGRPIALTELGFDTEKAAAAAVKELGLPLREVQAELVDARMPERPNHAATEPHAAAVSTSEAEKPAPDQTKADD